MRKTIYVTTAIPYVNAAPHIGFALEIIQADVIARFHRLTGDSVWFVTGTDENALKNVQAAQKEGLTPKELVDKYAQSFKNLKEILNLTFDDFIRTSQKRHFDGAQRFWDACKHDLYKKKYKGLYCVGCEEFKTPKEIINGECREHPGRKLEEVEEENYFFKLSTYQKKIEDLVSSDILKIIPNEKKKEVLTFIKSGLEDFSVSRSVARAKNWGIPVPGDPSQIMYVWFDALINYITALDYGGDGKLFKKYWIGADNILHCIGKGIIRFHAVYWPAMLMSAGLPLPKQELVHGYITVQGRKMSKTIGNVIDPYKLVNDYGVDAVRYYLLKTAPLENDLDFSLSHFREVYNADLANGIGNLVQRVAKLGENAKLHFEKSKQAELNYSMENYKFNEILGSIWEQINALDKYINETKPWTLKGKDLEKILHKPVAGLLEIAFLLKPFLPQTSQKIEEIFSKGEIKAPKNPLFLRLK